jgi:4-amino-4-deoxy-L-arabinose transferase-like glycosyltransferase
MARSFNLNWLTPGRCRLILAAALLLGFAARFAYVNVDSPLDLSGDEAHYWDWSRQLDWSYYSKGPAVAYVIRFGCAIFGDNELGVRFPALLLAIGTSIATYWLTTRAFGSERLALGAVMLCHVMPMCIAGSMLMTIDAPYYFAWGVATCFALHAVTRDARWAWIAAGAFVGVSFLAKYAALLWLVSMFVYLIVDRSQRRWLRTIWPYATTVVALLFTAPVLIWNSQHDWVTFGHVSRSTTENQSGFNPLSILSNFGQMVGSQIGILNPVVAGFMVGAVWLGVRLIREARTSHQAAGVGVRSRDHRDDAEATVVDAQTRGRTPPAPSATLGTWALTSSIAFLLSFSLPFLVVVSLVTLFKEIEPNWPVAAYFAMVPLAAWFVARAWPGTKGWLIGAIAIGLVFVPLAHYSHWLYPYVPGSPRKWDATARLRGWQEIGREVSLIRLQSDLNAPFVMSDKYWLAGLMAFYVDGHPKTYYVGSWWRDPETRDRLSQYDMWPDRALDRPELIGRDAIYVGQDHPELQSAFESVERLPNLPIVRQGVVLREQKIFIGRGFRGMVRPQDGKTKR